MEFREAFVNSWRDKERQKCDAYTTPHYNILNVPVSFMSEEVGESLENYLGNFMEYDSKNKSNFLRKYMRIRVLIDVLKSIKKVINVTRQSNYTRMKGI